MDFRHPHVSPFRVTPACHVLCLPPNKNPFHHVFILMNTMEEETVLDNDSCDSSHNSHSQELLLQQPSQDSQSQELLPRTVITSVQDPDMLVEDSDCPIAEAARVQRIIDGDFTDEDEKDNDERSDLPDVSQTPGLLKALSCLLFP